MPPLAAAASKPEIENSKNSQNFSEIQEIEVKKQEILYDGYFYDVTKWIPRHPGGSLIKFYTEPGEDATVAFQQFHNRSIKRCMAILKSLPKRKASFEELDAGLNSPTLKRHSALTKDFQELHAQLESEGLFEPSISHVIYRITELLALQFLGFYLLSFPSTLLKFFGIVFTSFFAGRCGFFVHECGHHSFTGNSKIDRLIETFVHGYGPGLSASYWQSQHNRHHAMPQRLQHDIDLETMPLIAFNKRAVKNPKEGRGFFVQNQSILFILVDCFLVGLAWKFYLHPRYAIQKRKYLELFFMVFHFVFFFKLMGVGLYSYLAIVWLTFVYMFTNFALSHSHLPVTDQPLHWVEYSLSHTIDIESNIFCDWWMGYLNYQIEHHLFPTMPQFRGWKVKDRVRELARKHNIPYIEMGFFEAFKTSLKNLADVSEELKHMS